jgi:hypothetical protein
MQRVERRMPNTPESNVRAFVLNSAFFILTCAASALAQPAREQNVEIDPLRCWWRTSDGAVAVGQPFSATLTCAVLETPNVRVVPDETPLAPETIQLAPFELIGGDHPADLRSGARRFFQYEYRLRIIDPAAIGKDVPLPPLVIHYRVESRVQAQASEGRDLTYVMPLVTVRVISLVPTDATDIRDASNEPFGAIEALRFRARLLDIAALTLGILGAVILGAVIVRAFVAPRRRATTAVVRLSDGAVLSAVASELAAVQSESRGGWNPSLLNRALAASRVAAAYALGRHVPHRALAAGAETPEGRVVVSRGLIRRRRSAVTSPITAADVKRELDQLPLTAPHERRTRLEMLHASLEALTHAQYSGKPANPADEAVTSALQVVHQLRRERRFAWLTPSPSR